jgi:hypothetical protein
MLVDMEQWPFLELKMKPKSSGDMRKDLVTVLFHCVQKCSFHVLPSSARVFFLLRLAPMGEPKGRWFLLLLVGTKKIEQMRVVGSTSGVLAAAPVPGGDLIMG